MEVADLPAGDLAGSDHVEAASDPVVLGITKSAGLHEHAEKIRVKAGRKVRADDKGAGIQGWESGKRRIRIGSRHTRRIELVDQLPRMGRFRGKRAISEGGSSSRAGLGRQREGVETSQNISAIDVLKRGREGVIDAREANEMRDPLREIER